MEKFKKLLVFALVCSWALFIPSLASAILITGSSTGTSGLLISASADFTFTTHDFGSGSVNAVQIILTNTSSTSIPPSPTTLRGNLLTGFFWTWSDLPFGTNLPTAATGFDGLAATVRTSNTTSISNVDIAPAVDGSGAPPTGTDGTYQLSNGPFGVANSNISYAAYDYGIGTVGYGLTGFSGAATEGDNFGIAAAGSNLTLNGLPAALPLIDTSATFWIARPTGLNSLDLVNFSFAFGSLPDNQVVVDVAKVPEPLTLILYGLGFAGAGLYRRLRKPK